MAFEEAFGVEIADEDAQKILKVKDAINYIESKQSKLLLPFILFS